MKTRPALTFCLLPALLCALLVLAASVRADDTNGRRTGVAVLKFAGNSEYARQLENALAVAMGKISTYQMVERTKLEQVIRELKVQDSTVIDPETAKKFGQVKGVDKLCYGDAEKPEVNSQRSGTVISFSVSFTATIHYTDVENGTTDTYTCKGRSTGTSRVKALNESMEHCAEDFVRQLTPDNGGSYLKILDVKPSEEYFVIEAGKNLGIKEASEFIVCHVKTITIKGIGEQKVYEEICRARPIKGGVQDTFTQLVPGKWDRELFGHWRWRAQAVWLNSPKDNKPENEIKDGMVVKVVPAEH